MDKTEKASKNNTQKPNNSATAQKEKTEMKPVNRIAKGILDRVSTDGFELVHPDDKCVLEIAVVTPLKDLVNGHMTKMKQVRDPKTGKVGPGEVPTLSLLESTISVRNFNEKTEKGDFKTKSEHLWGKEEWMAVLKKAPADMYCLNKKEAIRAGVIHKDDSAWIYCDDFNTEVHGPHLRRNNDKTPVSQEGYKIPSIGGFNYRTSTLENVPPEAIVVNYAELHHGWHRKQKAVRYARTTGKQSQDNAQKQQDMADKIVKLREDGNTVEANKLQKVYEFMYVIASV